jgi:hypothetical protein
MGWPLSCDSIASLTAFKSRWHKRINKFRLTVSWSGRKMTRNEMLIMARPTIPDLAKAAGVSTATVNRVLAGAENVRAPTRILVQEAAERIGFYGLGTIQAKVSASLNR